MRIESLIIPAATVQGLVHLMLAERRSELASAQHHSGDFGGSITVFARVKPSRHVLSDWRSMACLVECER